MARPPQRTVDLEKGLHQAWLAVMRMEIAACEQGKRSLEDDLQTIREILQMLHQDEANAGRALKTRATSSAYLYSSSRDGDAPASGRSLRPLQTRLHLAE
jgi:hypothetical protein